MGKDDNTDVVDGSAALCAKNPSQVLAGVHAKVEELNQRVLRRRRADRSLSRSTQLVDATVDKVSRTVFAGIGLVLIVLCLSSAARAARSSCASPIPFAMVVAFILMCDDQHPANLLSLGAIDFGIIVDGAIVMLGSDPATPRGAARRRR